MRIEDSQILSGFSDAHRTVNGRCVDEPDSFKQQDLLKAEVKGKVGDRSYEVVTENGKKFQHNHIHLRRLNKAFETSLSIAVDPLQHSIMVTTVTLQDPVLNKTPDRVILTSVTEWPQNDAQEPLPSAAVNVEGPRRTCQR